MEIFTVSFFGHRKVSQFSLVEERLEAVIQRLLEEKEYVEFLVGRSGEFDQLASSAVRRTKRTLRNDNSALVLVLPYLTTEYRNNEDMVLRKTSQSWLIFWDTAASTQQESIS